MKLTISKGNSKLGSVPNISLPPGTSCPSGVPCFGDGCYAMKAYHQYPAVRKAWDGNLWYWVNQPNRFAMEANDFIYNSQPPRFRWHVGGDIPDKAYLTMMRSIAQANQNTSFLCFTKRYEFDFSYLPDDLNIVLSAWPGRNLHNPYGLPVAYLAEDPRAPLNEPHIRCPGGCESCGYSCWNVLGSGLDIIFNRH